MCCDIEQVRFPTQLKIQISQHSSKPHHHHDCSQSSQPPGCFQPFPVMLLALPIPNLGSGKHHGQRGLRERSFPLTQPVQLMLHLHQTRIRINSLILKPGYGHCRCRCLPNPPRVRQPRVQRQRRTHAHHIHLGRQHPLRGGAPGDPTGHHDRHGSNLSDLLREREEVRLPIQGSLILGDPCMPCIAGLS